MNRATDWDAYYRRTPGYTQITRRISAHKLLATLSPHIRHAKAVTICEPGGANSCFMDTVMARLPVSRYHVVDLNAYGLELVRNRNRGTYVTTEQSDMRLSPTDGGTYDLVYSVGLIEHFDPADTARVIDGHFTRCKEGGLVLMTFPTPTIPYRIIRWIAEHIGKWSFPDERPLTFAEVEKTCQQHGRILHRSINWWIGLTQGYVLTQKHPVSSHA